MKKMILMLASVIGFSAAAFALPGHVVSRANDGAPNMPCPIPTPVPSTPTTPSV